MAKKSGSVFPEGTETSPSAQQHSRGVTVGPPLGRSGDPQGRSSVARSLLVGSQ